MPIYEYECIDCSAQFEMRCSFSEELEAWCPSCEGKVRRIFSPVPVIFKGSGFYITDSRNKNVEPDS
jgi:putative FmdB family regulatory protein